MSDWVYDDGGRSNAGFRGETGDCVTRAIAIATETNYLDVYRELTDLATITEPRTAIAKRSRARTGVKRRTYDAYLDQMNWQWTPTMQIGSGCRVHLRADELPAGRLIARLSGHVCAVIDGVVHDTYDPSRDGTRCVYGYWRPA